MQTKLQIQNLLASACISLNRHLGQHFLIDLNLMRLLVDSANINDTDIVLEVGCGTGSLTEGLAEHAGFCLAVEYDKALAKIAKEQLAKAKNVEIIDNDILENKNTISRKVINALILARRKHTGRILLVANLPYNVASPVMLNLVIGPIKADGMCVTVQKQVADRMTAMPGSSDYGTLSIYLCATGDVKRIRVLKPAVFWPAPKVDSAIVKFIHNKEKARRIKDMQLFSEVVGLFMCHRRKTLMACTKLKRGNFAEIKKWRDIFNRTSIDPHNRPEQLSPQDYIAIANLCHFFNKNHK